MHLTKIALIVEYDGARFHGFQVQRQSPTVQGELEEATRRLTGERLRVHCASRTDAGVHAEGQVVSFRTGASHPPETWVRALNHYLPEDVGVLAAYRIAPEYDIRKRATGRHYRYVILNRSAPSPLLRHRAYWVPLPLDVESMNQAASFLVGKRDFGPFASSLLGERASTVRVLTRAEVRRRGDLILVEVEGSSFLPQQVRRMAGALLDVGRGKKSVAELQAVANCARRGVAGPTLPPHGLFLQAVHYRDFPEAPQDRPLNRQES